MHRIQRRLSRRTVAAVLALGAPLAWLAAQPKSAELPQFEVASIRPVDPRVGHMTGVHVYRGGRVVISNFSLKGLIVTAFGVSFWQISGGEQWTADDSYNIEAKPSDAMRSSIKDLRYTLFGIEDRHLREMLQSLLIDRFQLRFHRQTKTGEVYLLERSGKRLRMRPTQAESESAEAASDIGAFGSIGYVGGRWSIFATTMPQLAQFSSGVLHAPVLDRTGLSGSFDYRQRVTDADPKYTGDQSASLIAFVQELGLKLKRSKGPVETFVIDHAAKPSAN